MSHWRAREEEGAENTVNLFTSSCSGSFLGPHFLFPCIDLQLANSSPSLLDPSAFNLLATGSCTKPRMTNPGVFTSITF